jgi:ribosomal protein S18 acetylase RimI-like enzyme/SAM-dependent methyltransferase
VTAVNSVDAESVPCPVCHEHSGEIWLDDGKITKYLHCSKCRSVYASPRSTRESRFAWLDAAFSVGPNAVANAQKRRPALKLEAEIIQRQASGGALLDVGCDLGDLFGFFPETRWARYGVELSASAAEHARKTYKAEVHVGTINNATLPSRAFDVITLLDTLYYVDDPAMELKEYRKLLKGKGVLAIEMAGQAYQLTRSRGVFCWLAERRWTRLSSDSAYLFWPAPLGVERLLLESGFEPVSWHVIPSPQQPGIVNKIVSDAYFHFISATCRHFFSAFTLAPKYLVLARSSVRPCVSGPLQLAASPNELETRIAQPRDVGAITTLHLTHIEVERQLTDILHLLKLYYIHLVSQKEGALYVATRGDEVVGYANLVRSQRRVLLQLLVRNPGAFLALARRTLRIGSRLGIILAKLYHEVLGGKWGPVGSKYGHAFELRSIVVAPNFRGRSIGSDLIVRCLEKASHLGARTVVAWVGEQNLLSQNLFLKAGFRKVGVNQESDRAVALFAITIGR